MHRIFPWSVFLACVCSTCCIGSGQAESRTDQMVAVKKKLDADDANIRRQGRKELRAALPTLLRELKDKNAMVRGSAAEALSVIGPLAAEAVPALVALCRDEDAHVRGRALLALGMIASHGKIAIPALLRALDDKDDARGRNEATVAQVAIIGLGRFGTRARCAVPKLLEALKAEDRVVRCCAMTSLSMIKSRPEQVIPAIVAILNDKKQATCRASAAGSLGKWGAVAKRAIPDLLKAFPCEGVQGAGLILTIQDAIVRAFGDMGPSARSVLPFLREQFQDTRLDLVVRAQAIHSIRKIAPNKETVALFIKWLNDRKYISYEQDLFTALAALGKLSVAPLIENLQIEDVYVRVRTIHALGRLGPAAAACLPLLEKIRASTAKNSQVFFEVARANIRINKK